MLKKELMDCKDSSEVIIFVTTEDGVYRPFRNIEVGVYNKDSFDESVHFDISVNMEYKNIHFPQNLSKEEVEDLKEKRKMLLEDLDEIEEKLGEFI